MDLPQLLKGQCHHDERGVLSYNNSFDLTNAKRIYQIAGMSPLDVRAWQGHQVEKRWMYCAKGEFVIELIKIDNWKLPSKNIVKEKFVLSSSAMDVLYVPAGYASSLQCIENNSVLVLMSNYFLGEINDEYRWDKDYFIS